MSQHWCLFGDKHQNLTRLMHSVICIFQTSIFSNKYFCQQVWLYPTFISLPEKSFLCYQTVVEVEKPWKKFCQFLHGQLLDFATFCDTKAKVDQSLCAKKKTSSLAGMFQMTTFLSLYMYGFYLFLKSLQPDKP